MEAFRILQSNIQSLTKNKNELAHELYTGKYEAALLTEIWTNENTIASSNIAGYHKILKPRLAGIGGGVGIYLRDAYNYVPLDLSSNEMLEIIGITIPNRDLSLISIYVNPRITMSELNSGMDKFLLEIDNRKNILIGGDFNAHNEA